MTTLDRQDLRAISQEAIEDWEFRNHGIAYPFNKSTADYESVRDDEMAYEIELTKRLSPYA